MCGDDSYRDMIFNDNPQEDLPWDQTYYALLRSAFGKPLGDNFEGFKIIENPDGKRKKRYADILIISASSVLVVSDKAIDALWKYFDNTCQLIKILPPIKGYHALHVTNVVKDAVDWSKSDYRNNNYGKVLYTPSLKENVVYNQNIFMLEEDITRIFFSDELRKKYELSELKGLDLSSRSFISAS